MADALARRRSAFGEQLRRELDQRQLSVRKFARLLDADRPDVARRNLARWIGGYNQPSRIHRIAVAETLGLPADAFLDDDDEEADPAMREAFALFVDLMDRLQGRARAEVAS